jgi:hypothetical protein
VYPHQTERLTEALMRGGLGALIATSPDNVAYLTGRSDFSEGLHNPRTFAVFTPKATALVVPAIDVPAVVAEAVDVDHVVCHGELTAAFPERQSAEVRRIQEIVSATTSSPAEALVTALALTGIRGESVGLDESRLGPAAWQDLVGHLSGLEVVPGAEHLAEARRVKSPYEIECLDRALRIAEEALDVVIQALERGMTERDAALIYAGEIVKRGASPLRAVVAMGDRTWIPTPRPTDRALRPGDLVRFDVGSTHRGYCGSVARTAVFGEPRARSWPTSPAGGLEAAGDAVRLEPAPAASTRRLPVPLAEGLPTRAASGHSIGLASSSGRSRHGAAIIRPARCVSKRRTTTSADGPAPGYASDHERRGPCHESIAPRPRRPGLIGMRVAISLRLANEDWTVASAYVVEAERLGVDCVWAAEAWGHDAVTPLAFMAARTSRIRLGTGIMQAGTRTPALIAMTAMSLAAMSDNRFILGLGVSGPQVIEGWHASGSSGRCFACVRRSIS